MDICRRKHCSQSEHIFLMFGNMPAVHLLSIVLSSEHFQISLAFQTDKAFNIGNMHSVFQSAVGNCKIVIIIIHQNGGQARQVLVNRNRCDMGILREIDKSGISGKKFHLIGEFRGRGLLEPVIFMPLFPFARSFVPTHISGDFYELPKFSDKI